MSANTARPTRPDSMKDKLVGRLKNPKVIVGGVITVAALWFVFANDAVIRIRLWVTWVSAPLWTVLLLTFLAGALVGFLFARRKNQRGEGAPR